MDDSLGVRAVALPESVSELVSEYDERIGLRDDYIWKWLHSLWPNFRLSPVLDAGDDAVREQKTLLTMYITLLDDLADLVQDEETFEEGAKLPFDRYSSDPDRTAVDARYLSFTRTVWDAFEASFRENPGYADYETLFRFDLRQTMQSMRYGFLANARPALANISEAYAVGSYNMAMFLYASIDLTYSPSFDHVELGQLRGLVYECQQMARIGNWVSTWKREITEGDLSSGVVIRALEEGLFAPEALLDGTREPTPAEAIAAIEEAKIVESFLTAWEDRRERIEDEYSLASVDVADYLSGVDTILEYHLESQGKK
jgi:hypothetical protein